ncbi:MAG: hypothetical protein E7194_09490 [Erysipelotrichaceae bacterium]|jgi:hypothetical protein|nr:hypothetical protein [Erysipelotrichaceae bacterium]
MKKIFLILTILVSSLFGACASKPSKASDLYNGCIFVVKNGEITSYGVYVEVKDRVSDFSVMNLRTYDETFAEELASYEADESKIYYRTDTVFNACHKDGYGDRSYFMSATRPLYKLPDQTYTKLISKLSAATIEVMLNDGDTSKSYTYNTVLPVMEASETSE